MLYVSVNQVWATNNVEFTLDERANGICPANNVVFMLDDRANQNLRSYLSDFYT